MFNLTVTRYDQIAKAYMTNHGVIFEESVNEIQNLSDFDLYLIFLDGSLWGIFDHVERLYAAKVLGGRDFVQLTEDEIFDLETLAMHPKLDATTADAIRYAIRGLVAA